MAHPAAFAVPGVISAAIGIGGISLESTNHSVCTSALGVLAADQSACRLDNGIYYVGLALAVLGGMLILGAIIAAATRKPVAATSVPIAPTAAPPGWYALPHKQGWVGYWSGSTWSNETPIGGPPAGSVPPAP